MKKNFYIELIFLILLGVFTSLSLPPYNYLLINFITLSLFYIFLVKKNVTNKNKIYFFLYGWLFGFGYFASNLYWISISLTFDEELKFLIPLTLILVPGLIALFYALASYLFVILKPKKNISSFFLFSVIFGIIEFLRGSILTGFPWNLIAYSFSNQLEILNITSLIGTYGFNLFCISLFISPSILVLGDNKKDVSICVIFLILTISFYFFGAQNLQQFNKKTQDKLNYKIRLVGSNINIDRFYNNIDPILGIEDLIEISSPKKNEKTIFIWPEGVIPGISHHQLKEYKWLFENKFNENHLLAIGINIKEKENQNIKYFNSLTIYDHNINIINSYKKINLVPFGEFIPFENVLNKFGLKTITNNIGSFDKGSSRQIIQLKNDDKKINFLPLICYEIIYSGNLTKNFDFDFILNVSEDGWFGKSIGPKQHFTHSKFRAIENGKYVIRSSNNGKAAIINPLGYIEKKIDYGISGYIDLESIRDLKPTLFSKYGNKIFFIFILLYILLTFSFNRIKSE